MNFVFNILSIAVCVYMCVCECECVFSIHSIHIVWWWPWPKYSNYSSLPTLFIGKHTQKYSVGVHAHIHSSIQMSTLSQLKEPLHLSLTPDFSTQTPHHCAGGEN